jgi:hypothetical protein
MTWEKYDECSVGSASGDIYVIIVVSVNEVVSVDLEIVHA